MLRFKKVIILGALVGLSLLISIAPVSAGSINVTIEGIAVNGTVTARELRVTDVGWADYVFEEDYPLLPLESLAEYIKANKRLPGIPSEKEIVDNGLKLSRMLSMQMQKIEELTLHLIALKKENVALKERIIKLEARDNRHLSK